ncbi:MAG: DNA repair protein RecN [Candidatus Marinimicrobia bacterium]|nr:DNA repair protein RecN [Candidatus Neomarinimicrobiota bacterium]
MIRTLYVKNLAIVRELTTGFKPGLNVITGETGSGKSILIDALSLLLGARASGGMIRTGENTAVIEGEFGTAEASMVIRRIIKSNGTSRAFIDDEPVKLSDLETITAPLVDLHGQHEHQSLLHVNTHLDYLDAYTGLLAERAKLAALHSELVQISEDVDALEAQLAHERERQELSSYQLNELEEANLSIKEESELDKEHKLLSQAATVGEFLSAMVRSLQENDQSWTTELGGWQRQLEHYAELAPEITAMAERVTAVKVDLDDLSFDITRFVDGLHHDPARLAQIDERLAVIESLKRKYGGSVEAAINTRDELRRAATQYTDSSAKLAELRDKRRRLQTDYSARCSTLSRKRMGAKPRLADEIVKVLARLDMAGTRFEVKLEQIKDSAGLCLIDGQAYRGDQSGCDQVEYLISPNPGEDLRPLVKIASGGEISRTMLGIKTVLADYDNVGALIFDEIDNGISGATAGSVGEALEELAEKRQVICITHLPQIASRGGAHFLVAKTVTGNRTESSIKALDGTQRRQEIARLISGIKITATGMDQAAELLRNE